MFVILFILWIILNGRITVEIVFFGIGIIAALSLFLNKFMGFSFAREKLIWLSIGRIIKYLIFLIIEVIKANLSVANRIIHLKEPDPVLIKFRTDLKSTTAKVLLANSITLTPGTITVDLDGDEFIVHGLHKSYVDGIACNEMEKKIKQLEDSVKKTEE